MPIIPAWPAPDHPSWREYDDYSDVLASVLKRALPLLTKNLLKEYRQAMNLIAPFLSNQVAPPQRLRVCYVVAASLAAVNEFAEALHWLDEARDLALSLEDDNATLDLVILGSSLNRAELHLSEAAADLRLGLVLLERGIRDHDTSRAALKLHFTVNLAGFEYYLGNYTIAETLLDEARDLYHHVPNEKLDLATIEWIQTHLYRIRGLSEQGLRSSQAAAMMYVEMKSSISAARAQALVAEVAMDLASKQLVDADGKAFLKLAHPHLQLAQALAREAKDPVGSSMVELAWIRYRQLSWSKGDRVGRIERVIKKAGKIKDLALLADALTLLAEEYALNGHDDAAREIYEKVLVLLEGSDLTALSVRARRALMHYKEWS